MDGSRLPPKGAGRHRMPVSTPDADQAVRYSECRYSNQKRNHAALPPRQTRGDDRRSRRRAESDSAITRPRKPNPVWQRLSPCAATKLSCAYIGWDADHDVSVISDERCANGVAYGGAWRDASHAYSAPITCGSPTLRGSGHRSYRSVMQRRRPPRHQARDGVSTSTCLRRRVYVGVGSGCGAGALVCNHWQGVPVHPACRSGSAEVLELDQGGAYWRATARASARRWRPILERLGIRREARITGGKGQRPCADQVFPAAMSTKRSSPPIGDSRSSIEPGD